MSRGINYDKIKGLILSAGGTTTGGTDASDIVQITTGGTVNIYGKTQGSTILTLSGNSGTLITFKDNSSNDVIKVTNPTGGTVFSVNANASPTISNIESGNTNSRFLTSDSQGVIGYSVIGTQANDAIVFTSATLSTKYNTQIGDSVNSVAVGGASAQAASIWKTYNIVQALDTILFPTLLPTYTIPTLTLSSSVTGTREVGSSISPLLTMVGTKNDAGNFTQLVFQRNFNSSVTTLSTNNSPTAASTTNVPDQYGYANPNSPNQTFTGTYTDSSYIIPAPPSSYFSSTIYQGTSVYLAGLAKKDNKGTTDARAAAVRSANAPQATSSNLTPSTITIVGIYPFFYGVSNTLPTTSDVASAISGGTATSSLTDANGTISITFNATGQFLWFAHNSSNTTKTKWFVDSLNNGSISSASDLFSTPSTVNVNSPLGYWTNKSFKIYISNYATTTTSPPNTTAIMQLRNT